MPPPTAYENIPLKEQQWPPPPTAYSTQAPENIAHKEQQWPPPPPSTAPVVKGNDWTARNEAGYVAMQDMERSSAESGNSITVMPPTVVDDTYETMDVQLFTAVALHANQHAVATALGYSAGDIAAAATTIPPNSFPLPPVASGHYQQFSKSDIDGGGLSPQFPPPQSQHERRLTTAVSSALASMSWFRDELSSREEAETLLMRCSVDTFLVRRGSKGGTFVLSIFLASSTHQMSHVLIELTPSQRYLLKEPSQPMEYDSLEQIVARVVDRYRNIVPIAVALTRVQQ
jgi:hypothetical protein